MEDISLTLEEYIKTRFNGVQKDFAKAQKVSPAQVTQWLNKHFIVVNDVLYSSRREMARSDTKIIVPVSGGKDSQATMLLALETHKKENITLLHYQTGWDHPDTYDHLKYIEEISGLSIEYTNFEEAPTMPDLIRRLGKFPYRMGRFCTDRYKQVSVYRWFKEKGYYNDGNAELWLGIRSDESQARARKYGGLSSEELHNYSEIYSSCPKSLAKHVSLRFPILDWSTQQVISYMKDKAIKLNPLYEGEGSERVGCYPCLLSSRPKQEKEFNTKFGKHQLKIIRGLEKEIGQKYEMFDTDQGSCETCNM